MTVQAGDKVYGCAHALGGGHGHWWRMDEAFPLEWGHVWAVACDACAREIDMEPLLLVPAVFGVWTGDAHDLAKFSRLS